MPQIETPYGRRAIQHLVEIIQAVKAADPLAPVTVAVPSNYAGLSLRRTVGIGAHRLGGAPAEGLVNVRFMVLPRVAEFLGAPLLAGRELAPLTPVVFSELVRQVLLDNPGPFEPAIAHPSTVLSLVRTFRDLRRATPASVEAIAGKGPRAGHLSALFAAFRERAASRYYDEEDLAAAAALVVADGSGALRDIGHVVTFLLDALTPQERGFTEALDRGGLITSLSGVAGEPRHDGMQIVAVPDPEEEVRTALRLALQRLAAGVPLHRMALLYPAAQPYALLIDQVFRAAGVLFNGPAPETLAQSITGRFLLAALRLAPEEFRRGAVMDWLTSCPVRDPERPARPVPSQRWEVLARDAGVIRGTAQWGKRMSTLAERLRRERQQAEEAGRSEGVLQAIDANVTYARELQGFVDGLFQRLGPLREMSWQAHARRASELLDRYLHRNERAEHWNEAQLRSYDKVVEALDELESLPAGAPVTETDFLTALEQQLAAPTGRTGHFGEGIFAGRYRDALGTDFDSVLLLGMNEGLVPGRGSDDPLLPDAERGDGMPPRGVRPDEERRAYLAALAAAPDRVLLFSRADPRAQRARLPSRWLLEAASALAGRPLTSEELAELPEQPWFSVIASFESGLAAALPVASQQDYDLLSLRAAHRAGRGDQHYLLDLMPRLRQGLAAQRLRRGRSFTEWDGRVRSDRPVLPPGRALSPTSLQTWAQCPFHYFLGNLLRVEAFEEPEDNLAITPLERGSLIHEALERFLREAPPRRRPDEPWSDAERARLLEITEGLCAEAENRGITGKPLLWELDRAQIMRDVAGFLGADEAMRREFGVVPAPGGLELRFGDAAGSAQLQLPSGRTVGFRGAIDRLDVSPSGDHVVVIDYKTGSSSRYGSLDKTTIGNGKFLQLLIYGLAAAQQHPGARIEAYYWFVTEQREYQRIGFPLDEHRLEIFVRGVDAIVNGIDQGLFPANPGAPGDGGHDNCRFCPYDRCCPADRGAVWSRKRSDPSLEQYLELAGGH